MKIVLLDNKLKDGYAYHYAYHCLEYKTMCTPTKTYLTCRYCNIKNCHITSFKSCRFTACDTWRIDYIE